MMECSSLIRSNESGMENESTYSQLSLSNLYISEICKAESGIHRRKSSTKCTANNNVLSSQTNISKQSIFQDKNTMMLKKEHQSKQTTVNGAYKIPLLKSTRTTILTNKKSSKCPQQMRLNTEIRAEKRKEYEKMKKDREEMLETIREQERMMAQLKMLEEIKRLRQKTEFRAQPIRKYKPI